MTRKERKASAGTARGARSNGSARRRSVSDINLGTAIDPVADNLLNSATAAEAATTLVTPLSAPPLVTPLGVLLGLALGVAAGALAVVLAHARLQKIPLIEAARAIVRPVPCVLGDFCPDSDRPVLESGKPSHKIWDMPRYLVKNRFEDYRSIFPGVHVSYLWDDPVVLYFDNAISNRDIQMMIDTATPRFSRSTVVQPDGTSVPDPSRTSDTAWIHFDMMDTKVRVHAQLP
jgi:hypothetical protein